MKILVTGSAGFIGSELVFRLLNRGDQVIGIDNHNDYYDLKLKEDRMARYASNDNYSHYCIDISDHDSISKVFLNHNPTCVINLAAQAGVRHSIDNPGIYIKSNIVGFANILECCRNYDVEHLIYASSSSVYGDNRLLPYSVGQNVDHPLSLYAATKKSNELMAHSYSHLFQLPTTGLRFFTVYGPWGRPDMAIFKFTKAILSGKPIDVFNNGNHKRDFTFIDDIVDPILKIIDSHHSNKYSPNTDSFSEKAGSKFCEIYNLGNEKAIHLLDCISMLENIIGIKAIKNLLPPQAGDMKDTFSDSEPFYTAFNYKPKVDLETGISKFFDWYKNYYNSSINLLE